jgi:CheY-like chemotaxis protein
MILLVDDDPINTRVLGELLNHLRYSARVVQSGAEALEQLAAQPVDLIICSLVLPDMDGFTLLGHIRERPYLCDVPFVVCTGTVDAATVSRAVLLGAADFVMKPVRAEPLAARLERVLMRAPVRWEGRTSVIKRLRMNTMGFHSLLEMASKQLDQLVTAVNETIMTAEARASGITSCARLLAEESDALAAEIRRMHDAALYVGATRCATLLAMLSPAAEAPVEDLITLREALAVERVSFDHALTGRGASVPRLVVTH